MIALKRREGERERERESWVNLNLLSIKKGGNREGEVGKEKDAIVTKSIVAGVRKCSLDTNTYCSLFDATVRKQSISPWYMFPMKKV